MNIKKYILLVLCIFSFVFIEAITKKESINYCAEEILLRCPKCKIWYYPFNGHKCG